ncbi:MAG TPA: hypothetical protein VL985_08730 [Stellaceae bacterium]|nr:hypothetical protein [Stellaceae bacterium]
MPVLLLSGLGMLLLPVAAAADPASDDLGKLRADIQKEIAALKRQEAKLHQEFLDLDRKSKLLDRKSELLDEQLRTIRAAGAAPAVPPAVGAPGSPATISTSPAASEQLRMMRGAGAGAAAAPPEVGAAGSPATISASPTVSSPSPPSGIEVAQAPAGAPPATAPTGSPPTPPPAGGESAPIQGPSAAQQQARQVVETAPALSTGGVLTPKGQFVIDPSIEYDYWSQNQLGVNGFQIIPGITFGNIFANRVEQNITTAAVTGRYGITDRWEVNVKVPYVYNTGQTISLIPEGTMAQLLSVNASGNGIGDIQFGSSYQINSGENGWPILIANALFKTATGTSPFQVPIITEFDPNGGFLEGNPKQLATGTGFYAIEPSFTVLLPTAPGVLFANLQDIHNFGRTVTVQSVTGGPGTPVFLQPGENPAITFGIGFSLNDRAALTFSYQQQHVFTAYSNHQAISGSPYSFGTFNFGLGYQISRSTRLNLSVGIGAGPNTPVAKVLLELPYKFSL